MTDGHSVMVCHMTCSVIWLMVIRLWPGLPYDLQGHMTDGHSLMACTLMTNCLSDTVVIAACANTYAIVLSFSNVNSLITTYRTFNVQNDDEPVL